MVTVLQAPPAGSEKQQQIRFYCGNQCAKVLDAEHCRAECQRLRASEEEEEMVTVLQAPPAGAEKQQQIRFYCGNECPKVLDAEHCRAECQRLRGSK